MRVSLQTRTNHSGKKKKNKRRDSRKPLAPLLCLFLDFVAFARDVLLDLFEIEMRDLGVVAIDDLGELFECRPFGLDVHEVDEGELEPDPDGVDDVQFPGVVEAERLEGDRVGVLVEQQRDLDRDVEDHEALGAQLVREDLDGVAHQETRPRDRVEDLEEPDEDDEGLVGSRRPVLAVQP